MKGCEIVCASNWTDYFVISRDIMSSCVRSNDWIVEPMNVRSSVNQLSYSFTRVMREMANVMTWFFRVAPFFSCCGAQFITEHFRSSLLSQHWTGIMAMSLKLIWDMWQMADGKVFSGFLLLSWFVSFNAERRDYYLSTTRQKEERKTLSSENLWEKPAKIDDNFLCIFNSFLVRLSLSFWNKKKISF